jgi:hypothetical protein
MLQFSLFLRLTKVLKTGSEVNQWVYGKRATRQNVFHFAGVMRKTVGLSRVWYRGVAQLVARTAGVRAASGSLQGNLLLKTCFQ